MFKRKTDYGYYSDYNSKSSRPRLRLDRTVLIVVACIVLVLGLVGFINRDRIHLMYDGYSLDEANAILELDGDDISTIYSFDKLDHIETWIDNSKKVKFYNAYEKYYEINPKYKVKKVIKNVDKIFTSQQPKLKALGYSDKVIWDMIKTSSIDDLQSIIDNSLTAKQTAPYRKVKGYELSNMSAYIEKYKEVKNYNYAVNIVNYPFLVGSASQTVNEKYTITNSTDLLALVKKGFYLPKSYEPKDLVTPDMPIAPDCENSKLRKVASDALVKMYKAAKEEGYNLVLNSGYRSYETQQQTYKDFESKYGGQYAAEYVATPGASEHQTGLGVDLTSESVVNKQKNVFGDTSEYKWVMKNAAKYGFICRFPEDKSDITGIEHEPWHFRYVGVKIAKEITDKGWTFEEYCLKTNTIPQVTKN
ncbi:MAG: M15 family metallopeptidase [Thomasclavelia sp.]|nr:M15 family metallopeptidase [Thomasclavelia sp.]